MRAKNKISASPLFRRAAFVAATMVCLSHSGSSRAEIISLSVMLQGTEVTEAQCSQTPSTVWVEAYGQTYCMRYYASAAGGAGTKPLVWLSGDKLGRLDPRTLTFSPREQDKDFDTGKIIKFADHLSKISNGPAVYLARVGIDGSSGHHSIRRSFLELEATNQALNAIKVRYGLDGFHIAGQSGGAGLTGGLLALRDDISCAVPGAGRLAGVKNGQRIKNTYLEHFDTLDAVANIAKNSGARILVVTDPDDQVVKIEHQQEFVNALRQAGRNVEQLYVQATDEKNHGVAHYTQFVVSRCIRGETPQQIAHGLNIFMQKRLEKHARINNGPYGRDSTQSPAYGFSGSRTASGAFGYMPR